MLCPKSESGTKPGHFTCCKLCRLFLRKLRDTLRVPVLALVDSDPYGLKILSVYMKGAPRLRDLSNYVAHAPYP